jgi:hypothetical protein
MPIKTKGMNNISICIIVNLIIKLTTNITSGLIVLEQILHQLVSIKPVQYKVVNQITLPIVTKCHSIGEIN